eukprot:6470807-Amphidinium_carterae.2
MPPQKVASDCKGLAAVLKGLQAGHLPSWAEALSYLKDERVPAPQEDDSSSVHRLFSCSLARSPRGLGETVVSLWNNCSEFSDGALKQWGCRFAEGFVHARSLAMLRTPQEHLFKCATATVDKAAR